MPLRRTFKCYKCFSFLSSHFLVVFSLPLDRVSYHPTHNSPFFLLSYTYLKFYLALAFCIHKMLKARSWYFSLYANHGDSKAMTYARQLDFQSWRKIQWHNSLAWVPWISLVPFFYYVYFLVFLHRKFTLTKKSKSWSFRCHFVFSMELFLPVPLTLSPSFSSTYSISDGR